MTPPDELTPETLAELGMEEAMTPRGEAIGEYASVWTADRAALKKAREGWDLSLANVRRLEARIEALEKQIGLHPMPDYGDLMTLEEFLVAVKAGGIGDDDGSAYLASALGCTGIQVRPSDVLGGITLGTKFSHIAWFNK